MARSIYSYNIIRSAVFVTYRNSSLVLCFENSEVLNLKKHSCRVLPLSEMRRKVFKFPFDLTSLRKDGVFSVILFSIFSTKTFRDSILEVSNDVHYFASNRRSIGER